MLQEADFIKPLNDCFDVKTHALLIRYSLKTIKRHALKVLNRTVNTYRAKIINPWIRLLFIFAI